MVPRRRTATDNPALDDAGGVAHLELDEDDLALGAALDRFGPAYVGPEGPEPEAERGKNRRRA